MKKVWKEVYIQIFPYGGYKVLTASSDGFNTPFDDIDNW